MGRAGGAAGLLVVLLVALLAACTNEPPPQVAPAPPPTTVAPPEPTTVVVGVDALGAGFNPHLIAHQSPVTTALSTLVLPSVFRPDAGGDLRLDQTVATSARVSSTDPFTVSYELNVQASWTTNAPIAAEDFVYLWQRMRSEPGTADAAGYDLISDVRSRAGGKAVDVVFAQPYPQWQRLFSGLLPAHILKDAPGSWTGALANGLPASGGPFRIASVDRARDEIVLSRNDQYWATPTTLDRVVLRAVDRPTMVDELRSGDLEVALPDSDPQIRRLVEALGGAYRIQNAPQPLVVGLGLRSDDGPLADPRVRQAIAASLDREALRAAVAPDALPADAFGLAPSQAGYASTAPPGAPVRPDPAAAQREFTAAGYVRDGQGRWSLDGRPLEVVIGAAAERPADVRLAQAVATQLTAAGIGAAVVAPPGADLFGQPAVPPTPPSTTTTTPTTVLPTVPTTNRRSGTAATPPPTTTSTAAPTPTTAATPSPTPGNGGVRVDLMVLPSVAGGDPAARLASDFGCPRPAPGVTEPPRTPTGFCFPALQLLLDGLLTGTAAPETAAVVEKVLWAQLPVLPLYQPMGLVLSSVAADAATGITPGPLATGPLTGAQRWAVPAG